MTEIDPCFDLIKYLRDLGAGGDTRFSWIKMSSLDGSANATAFVNDLPDPPAEAVVAVRYAGRPADEVFGNPFYNRHPRIQFLFRHPSSSKTLLDRAVQVMKELGKVRDKVINGTKYEITVVSEPEEIGPDTSGRQRATLNLEVSFQDS